MTRETYILCGISFLVFVFLSSISFADSIANMEAGKTLYQKHCSACHGEEGSGQVPVQPNGGWTEDGKRLAPALNGKAHSWHHPPDLLFDYIEKVSIDQSSPMPSFGGILDHDEILLIIKYIQSLWPDSIQARYFRRYTE